MAFTEHKITAFQKKLTDLPDQPNLSAAELKAYFDSSPEELRQALNGVCTDAERLDSRVSGIVAETFGDTIPKTMLTDELQKEIDAKAEETTVAARLEAEQAARERADATADTRLSAVETEKCEVFVGVYTGTGQNKTKAFSLGFRPKAVLVSALAFRGDYTNPSKMNLAVGTTAAPNVRLTDKGFEVFNYMNCTDDEQGDMNPYRYIVFK